MKRLDDDFIFSQSSLQDYVDCPKRFWLKYVERLRYPASQVEEVLAFERRMANGEAFHRLVHQHLVGIPPALLRQHAPNERVEGWLDVYLRKGLERVPPRRYIEQVMTVGLGDAMLMAKFDLLALNDNEALIVDWKTSPHIPKREKLAKRLQTIVYRYVLVRGGTALNGGRIVAPEQVRMRYWYADKNGESVEFSYDAEQFRADETYLLGLVSAIGERREYEMTEDERLCRFCTYRSLCERGKKAGVLEAWESDGEDDWDFDLDVTQIGEVMF